MRGDLGRIGYEGAVEWGRKALAHLGGATPTEAALSVALAQIGAPFTSAEAPARKWGKSFVEYRAELMASEPIGPGVAVNHVAPHDWRASWAELSSAFADRKRAQHAEVDRFVRIKADRPVVVLVLGDMHIGSPSTNYPRLDWVLSQIKRTDIQVFAVFIGDVVDQMIWPAVRFEGRASPLSVHKEVLTAVGWMRAASENGHMIGGVCGNHDLMSEQHSGLSSFALAMEQLRVPLAKNELILDVQVGEQVYKWELRHATRGGPTSYNRASGPIRHNRENYRDSEIVCTGHIHQSATYPEKLHGRVRWSIQVGAYKEGDLDDYAVNRGFKRGDNRPDYGVVLWHDRHLIEVLDTEQALRAVEAETKRGAGGDGGSKRCSTATRTRGTRTYRRKRGKPRKRMRAVRRRVA